MAAKLKLVRRLEDIVDTVRDKTGIGFLPCPDPILTTRLVGDLRSFAAVATTRSTFWGDICHRLLACAESDDPARFMRWPPIALTMVPRTIPYSIAAYRNLRKSPRWTSHWVPILYRSTIGAPPAFLPDLRTDNLAVQHASHLDVFESRRGVAWQDADCIVEFGGGFGSMCRTVHQLGFKGRYVIFDLPPVTALQRFYLGAHGIEAEYGPTHRVSLCHRLDEVDAAMTAISGRVSMISTWAMSEMPLDLRFEIEPFLLRGHKLLLAYQAEFEGNDNRRYFDALKQRLAARFDLDLPAVEAFPGNEYIFATAKA